MSKATPTPGGKLTARQRRFVEEYVIDLNAVQAYFRAYGRYKTRNGRRVRRSYGAAREHACSLLTKPNIQAEITAAKRGLSRATRLTAERVCRELAYLAFSDPHDLVDPDTNEPLPVGEMTAAARRSVASIEVERRREAGPGQTPFEVEKVKLKQYDKAAALDKLMKHLGLYAENNALESILGQLPDALREQVVAALAAGK